MKIHYSPRTFTRDCIALEQIKVDENHCLMYQWFDDACDLADERTIAIWRVKAWK